MLVQPSPQEDSADPFSPAPPEAPRFSPTLGGWVFSRYEDVLAAFRKPQLWPTSPKAGGSSEIGDVAEQLRVRAATSAAFSASHVAEWQAQLETLAHTFAQRLASNGRVDLFREFARPWSLEAAAVVTGAPAMDRHLLSDLARLAHEVSAAAAEPGDPVLQANAEIANAELEACFQGDMPMRAPTFVALSQTLPCFLSSAWFALLRHPIELARLSAEPGLMPRAVDELLRYAGLARTLFRRATAASELAGVKISEGERVILMIASANRDPAQFPDPNRLDIGRRVAGQLALGAGPHSCVGALLIRMAASVATQAFVRNYAAGEISGCIEWGGGSGFRYPASLPVQLPPKPNSGPESRISR